jgi:hypothetical protein
VGTFGNAGCKRDLDVLFCCYSLQADEATAAEVQREQDDEAERRHFQALRGKFGMAEKA